MKHPISSGSRHHKPHVTMAMTPSARCGHLLCLTVESRRSLGRIQWVHGTRSIKSMKSTKSMSFERFSKKQAVWSASVQPWSPRLFDAWTSSWILTMASFCGEVWTWGMGLSRPRFGAVHSQCFSRVWEIMRITRIIIFNLFKVAANVFSVWNIIQHFLQNIPGLKV